MTTAQLLATENRLRKVLDDAIATLATLRRSGASYAAVTKALDDLDAARVAWNDAYDAWADAEYATL
jgi:methyl coenzyme M reductase gamma subunit